MDLYKSLINDDEFLNYFCDVLEDNISEKAKYKVNIGFKKQIIQFYYYYMKEKQAETKQVQQKKQNLLTFGKIY